jgi:hypothetical protein
VALVLVAAGCGSSKKKSSAPPAATTTSHTTTAATTATPVVKGAGSCIQLAALGAKFSTALSSLNASAKGDPAKQAANTAKLFAQFASAAPSEIRGDFEVYAKMMSSYASIVAKTHLKPGKVPSAADLAALQKASKAFSSPELAKASAHLTAWAKQHCPNGLAPKK